MAAPTALSPTEIDGFIANILENDIPLQDGYRTIIMFTSNPDIAFFIKTITPPGYDGGDVIETTTMLNDLNRTFSARSLLTLTPVTFTAAFDPIVYTEVLTLLNNKTDTATLMLPDRSTIAFFGYLKNFDPQEFSEGTQPEAQCTIQPTNWDPVNKIEAGPVVTEIAGT